MVKNLVRRLYQTAGLLGLAGSIALSGCGYFKPSDKGILEGYTTISEKSETMLEKPKEEINPDLIQKGKLPIYSGEKFEKDSFGDFNIIRYHARYIESKKLKEIVEEGLAGVVSKVSENPKTNQIIMRIDYETTDTQKRDYARDEKGIKRVIESVDILPPQIMIVMRMIRDYADKTIDWASFLGISPEETKGDGLYPNVLLNIPGAGLRVPERAAERGLGIQYGIIGKIGSNIVNARLDSLQSLGFVKDVARPTLTAVSGEEGQVDLTQELPFQENVYQGGALYAQTKYKEVKNFMKMTAWARDDGLIYLENVSAGVGSFNPTGVLQIPGITQRNIETKGVYLKQGETLILGGFRIDHMLGIERVEPWLGRIPILGRLLPWAEDTERSTNEILFLITPHYIDVNSEQKATEKIEPKVEEEKGIIKSFKGILDPAY